MNDIARPLGWPANHPPDPSEIAAERVDREVASANAWVEQVKVIEDEAAATKLRTKLKQLHDLWKEYDKAREEEKKPLDEKVAAVQGKWRLLLSKLERCRKAIEPLESAWLRLKQRRHDEDLAQRQREAAEAQLRADQLTAQAQAGGPGAVTNMIAATEAAVEASQARQAVAAVPRRAQTRDALGNPARGLRVTWHAQVVDWNLWYAHVRERGEVRDLLSRLANEVARSKDGPRPPDGAQEGISPAMPGCLIYSVES